MPFPFSATEGPRNTQNFLWLSQYFVVGTGSPEGKVKARIGAVYMREDGTEGASFYVKESGNGTAEGWKAQRTLQLLPSGVRKENFGVTGEIAAGATTTISHGLGVVPASIQLTPLTAGANLPTVPEGPTTTTFKVKNTGGVAIFCYWRAIG